jgi:hypothetical protein
MSIDQDSGGVDEKWRECIQATRIGKYSCKKPSTC